MLFFIFWYDSLFIFYKIRHIIKPDGVKKSRVTAFDTARRWWYLGVLKIQDWKSSRLCICTTSESLTIYATGRSWICRVHFFFWKLLPLEITPRLQFQPTPFLLQSNRGIECRGRHGTGTVSRKIFSPRERVPEFFSPRDSPSKLSPGIPRLANLSPDPGWNFEIGSNEILRSD